MTISNIFDSLTDAEKALVAKGKGTPKIYNLLNKHNKSFSDLVKLAQAVGAISSQQAAMQAESLEDYEEEDDDYQDEEEDDDYQDEEEDDDYQDEAEQPSAGNSEPLYNEEEEDSQQVPETQAKPAPQFSALERIKRAEEFKSLSEKYQKALELKAKVEAFARKNDLDPANGVKLVLTDDKGQTLNSQSSKTTAKVLEFLLQEASSFLNDTENTVLNFKM